MANAEPRVAGSLSEVVRLIVSHARASRCPHAHHNPLPEMQHAPIAPIEIEAVRQLHMRHRVAATASECHPQSPSNYGAVSSHTASDTPAAPPVIRQRNRLAMTECHQESANSGNTHTRREHL